MGKQCMLNLTESGLKQLAKFYFMGSLAGSERAWSLLKNLNFYWEFNLITKKFFDLLFY